MFSHSNIWQKESDMCTLNFPQVWVHNAAAAALFPTCFAVADYSDSDFSKKMFGEIEGVSFEKKNKRRKCRLAWPCLAWERWPWALPSRWVSTEQRLCERWKCRNLVFCLKTKCHVSVSRKVMLKVNSVIVQKIRPSLLSTEKIFPIFWGAILFSNWSNWVSSINAWRNFCCLKMTYFFLLAYFDWGLLMSVQQAFYPSEAEGKGATPSQVMMLYR